jgi:single-strand DNA-binding protein
MFNKVILLGNLTRDPELRYTPGGMAIVNTGIAINRNFKKQSGAMYMAYKIISELK